MLPLYGPGRFSFLLRGDTWRSVPNFAELSPNVLGKWTREQLRKCRTSFREQIQRFISLFVLGYWVIIRRAFLHFAKFIFLLCSPFYSVPRSRGTNNISQSSHRSFPCKIDKLGCELFKLACAVGRSVKRIIAIRNKPICHLFKRALSIGSRDSSTSCIQPIRRNFKCKSRYNRGDSYFYWLMFSGGPFFWHTEMRSVRARNKLGCLQYQGEGQTVPGTKW